MSQRSKSVLPNQLVVFYCFALFCSLAKANWKKEAFQKANPACKISLNPPVGKKCSWHEGSSSHSRTSQGPFNHIWKFHMDTEHDSNGWWDWKTKKTPLSLSFLLGGRDPVSDLHPEKPLEVFWRFYVFFSQSSVGHAQKESGILFCDSIFSSGELFSY